MNILMPTARQALVSLALSLSMLMLVFQSLVLPHLLGGNGFAPYLEAGKQQQLVNLNSFSLVRLGVQGLFWAIVGLCAYIIYLGLVNAVVEARNEVVLSTEFANKGSLSKWIKKIRLQFVLLAVVVFALIVTAQYGVDLWFNMAGRLIIEGYSLGNALAAVGSVIGLAINIYLLWILSEAAVTADR